MMMERSSKASPIGTVTQQQKLDMVAGSAMDKSRLQGSIGGHLQDSLRNELEKVLQEQCHRQILGSDVNRSGSAPPTVEGLMNTMNEQFTDLGLSDTDSIGGISNNFGGNLSENRLRYHPAYLSYYYSRNHINPRLPPPLLSKEDWRVAQRLQSSGSSVGGDAERRPSLTQDDDRSSLFSVQPGIAVEQAEKDLTQLRGSASQSLSGKKSLGPSGAVLRPRCKSFADILQEGIDRNTVSQSQLSRPASCNNFHNISEWGHELVTSRAYQYGVAPSDLLGVQNCNTASPHSSAPAAGSSLSSRTTESYIAGGVRGLPPVGSKVSPTEKMKTPIVPNMRSAPVDALTGLTSEIRSALPQDLEHQSDLMLRMGSGPKQSLQKQRLEKIAPVSYATLASQNRQCMSSLANLEASDLCSAYADPQYLQYIQASNYASASSADNINDLQINSNYAGVSHVSMDANQKEYLTILLAQQKQRYDLSLLANPRFFYQRNYRSPYDLGAMHFRNPVAYPAVGSKYVQSNQKVRNPVIRSSIGGSMASRRSDISTGESRHMPTLLDEFKNSNRGTLELSDITGHVIEFSTDQYGSRFIQQKLESATEKQKVKMFEEILPYSRTLMTDVFGNYVIQKVLEHGTENQRKELANQLTGYVLLLSLQMYGCRVVQKALEVVDLDHKAQIASELDGAVMKCIRDQNGNHVIQKCIECIPQDRIEFIISSFHGQVVSLSTHPYGCRVIQRVLENCKAENTQVIMHEILKSVRSLAQDQYGNYVIQHILERGKPSERSDIIRKVVGHVVNMSRQKFASNVVEKCLTFGGPEERQLLVNEMLGSTEENEPLQAMMKDPFGNYVVQKVLETCDDGNLEQILSRIRIHLNALKRYTYGKHIVSRIEKLIATGERRIGLSSSVSLPNSSK